MIKKITFALCFVSVLPLTACMVDSAQASRPNNRIAVIADPAQKGKMVAIPPECKRWQQDPGDGFENHFRDQYECAQNYNLAKMIAEPKDLIRGREGGPTDANPAVLGIERYRNDKKKELISPKEINATTKN